MGTLRLRLGLGLAASGVSRAQARVPPRPEGAGGGPSVRAPGQTLPLPLVTAASPAWPRSSPTRICTWGSCPVSPSKLPARDLGQACPLRGLVSHQEMVAFSLCPGALLLWDGGNPRVSGGHVSAISPSRALQAESQGLLGHLAGVHWEAGPL